MINNYIEEKINENIDLEYLKFHSKLVNDVKNINGVRVPILRSIAKDVSKMSNVNEYLENPILDSYEQIMIYGLTIGYLKLDINGFKKYLKKFIPYIDNWAVCDTVVSNLKNIKKNKDVLYNFVLEYLNSSEEFSQRFAIIILMDYYLDDKYYMEVLEKLINIKSDKYYVNMAISWLVSTCYIKYPKYILNLLKDRKFNIWVHNKSIQKIIESNRIDKKEKENLRKLKVK